MSVLKVGRGAMKKLAFALVGMTVLQAGGSGGALAKDAPKRGGTLVYLEQAAHASLYPPLGSNYASSGILNQILDRLTYQNPRTLAIEPWLAESWEINAENTEFAFHLKSGVTFSDGTPLDAAAVAANFDVYGKGDSGRKLIASEVFNRNYDRADAVDGRTVKIYFKKATPGFLQGTSTIGLGIVSPATLNRDFSAFGDARTVIGSGPFVVVSQTTGSEVVMKAREDYAWGPTGLEHQGRSYLNGIQYVIVPEDGVRIGALLAGQADAVRQIQSYEESKVTSAGYSVLARNNGGLNNTIIVRPDNPMVADLRVRQALQHGLNRPAIVETLYSANYPVATSIMAHNVPGYVDISEKLAYNPELARKLLDEAGWAMGAGGFRQKNGVALNLAIYESPLQPQNRSMLQLIAQQWAQIGVKLSVLPGDAGSKAQDNLDPAKTPLFSTALGRTDPDVLLGQLHYSNRNLLLQTGGSSGKVKGFRDNKLNEMLEAVATATDQAKRLEVVKDLQIYVVDQAYSLPIFEEPQTYGVAPYVKGVALDAVARPVFYDVWLDK